VSGTAPREKDDLRREARARRRALSGRPARSRLIHELVCQLPELALARAVHVYLATPVEVATYALVLDLLRRGVKVFVPVVGADAVSADAVRSQEVFARDLPSLVVGPHGIPQPRTLRYHVVRQSPLDAGPLDTVFDTAIDTVFDTAINTAIDTYIVPLVGFDRTGARLGNGTGHYDRILAKRRPDASVVGLAFATQEMVEIPQDPHDVRLDMVVTERAVVRLSARPRTEECPTRQATTLCGDAATR
jgi:5-formyltetrahydrofolate cyclo-ligase